MVSNMSPLERNAFARGRRAAAVELGRSDGDTTPIPHYDLYASWMADLPYGRRDLELAFEDGWKQVLADPSSAPQV